MKLEISSAAQDAIRAHAASDPEREVCGLLFGSAGRIDTAQPTDNVATNPTSHFEIDPTSLFRAIRAERSGGPKIAGYYHSHLSGRAEPSATDRAMAAADGRLWLIVAGSEMTAWRAAEHGFVSVELLPV